MRRVNWHWAEAIIDGETVPVSLNGAPGDRVRYAFATNPASADLYNLEELPASPFHTDEWPRPTENLKWYPLSGGVPPHSISGPGREGSFSNTPSEPIHLYGMSYGGGAKDYAAIKT